jgi:hypothetical protein
LRPFQIFKDFLLAEREIVIHFFEQCS